MRAPSYVRSPSCLRGSKSLLAEGVVLGHEAALAAGGVVAVDDALRGGPVERTDRVADGGRGGRRVARIDRGACTAHIGPRRGDDRAIAQAAAFAAAHILHR